MAFCDFKESDTPIKDAIKTTVNRKNFIKKVLLINKLKFNPNIFENPYYPELYYINFALNFGLDSVFGCSAQSP
ncbi:hypothetical protein CYCD_19350 [Tenuifilaceae bacterium CYCD]|nr:hypothetical protein CYCD_19350 [Tenuifilaceae bacterium CYCD]